MGEPRPAVRTLGRYELIANIGVGGMAEVHLARQRGPMGFEKLVVVKTVHGHLAAQREFIDLLLDEARIAALVKHANVVDIYDLGEVDGAYFIAMEYLEGEPLLAVLRAGKTGKRLDPLSTARLIADCAEGLHAAHELHGMTGQPLSVVHHDVSPGNVMVLYSGEVKLVDFGVAKAENRVLHHAGHRILMKGKMGYMAPEKLRGQVGDRRSDVFSLGVVLWEGLTLRRLFRGETEADVARTILEAAVPPPSTLDNEVPRELDPIVARALAKDPDQRFPTAKAMASALEDVLRARRYSGKNDAIGTYMRGVFGDRLLARRELIKTIANTKTAPSRQAIAQAFHVDASGPVRTDGGRHNNPTFSQPALAVVPPTPPSVPETVTDVTQFSDNPGTMELTASTLAISELHGDEAAKIWAEDAPATVIDDSGQIHAALHGHAGDDGDAVAMPARRPSFYASRRNQIAIGGMAALLVFTVIMAIVVTRGGDGVEADDAVAKVPEAPETVAAPVAVAEPLDPPPVVDPPPPPPAPVVDPRSTAKKTDDRASKKIDKRDKTKRDIKQPDKPPHKAPDKAPDKPPPPPPPPESSSSPDDLYNEGTRLVVGGKLREAIAKFDTARKINPRYAKAYRGLGMARQALGDKSGAIGAFQTYLKLSPNASDSDTIKKRLQQLGGK